MVIGHWLALEDQSSPNRNPLCIAIEEHSYPSTNLQSCALFVYTRLQFALRVVSGSVEHWNDEAGAEWLQRIVDIYQNVIWINPVELKHWEFTPSTQIVNQIISNRMFPLTLEGLDNGMKELSRNK